MTDDERDKIERDANNRADVLNRIKNLEKDTSDLRGMVVWVVRAIWGGAAYLVMELFKFLSQGGSLK